MGTFAQKLLLEDEGPGLPPPIRLHVKPHNMLRPRIRPRFS